MLNECEQLWPSRAAQALDAHFTTHVVAPSVNPALDYNVTGTQFWNVLLYELRHFFIQKLAWSPI